MRLQFLLLLIFILSTLPAASMVPLSDGSKSNSAKHDLEFTKLATSWDEAIPLGNGMLGALVWQKGDRLRFSLDRADLWDLRPMENLSKPEFSYKWVREQVESKNYKPVQLMFDQPYDQLPAPSKIPGAALEFETGKFGTVEFVRLTLENALCEVKWENGTRLLTFVDASGSSGWFQFTKVNAEFVPVLVPPRYRKEEKSESDDPVTGQDLQRLGYEQGKVENVPSGLIYRQKGWNGFEYEAAVSWKYSGNKLTGIWSISSSFPDKTVQKTAHELVSGQIIKDDFDRDLLNHSEWWKSFWGKSSITLPDQVLEKQWFLEQYKFGSAARPDAPPISLQAVWTADNGKLPPWKGDFHHDLNTQLSYWPAYSSNHTDLGEGFLNWLWGNRETFKKYTKTYFGTSGMNVPGVTTLTGEPMGGWIQYSFGPTVGCWLAQHFYLHWVFTKDEKFLREKAYPWISDVAVYIDELSVKHDNGMRKIPISSSPEIHDNSINAWFSETTNYDLAFVRWTFEKAAELALLVGKQEEASKWKSRLKEWPEFATDREGGLAFAPNHPYAESHRHFSHLVGWHPLGIIDWSNGDRDRKIILETLKNLEKTGPDWWCGYSYSWLGNLYARAMMGEKAAETLRIFSENFCLPNSFHVNGEQYNKGFSRFKYRPFTLEGNFAFASAIQEMLVQSHTGTIRLFPAIPAGWKEVNFTSLRCQGAFLVSASRENGQIRRVEIVSEKGGQCSILNPFGQEAFDVKYSWKGKISSDGDVLSIEFPVSGRAELFLK